MISFRDLFVDLVCLIFVEIQIIEGVEKRIDLEPFKTDAELDKILDRNTMLVINATGYESTEILIKDLRGNILTLGRDASD